MARPVAVVTNAAQYAGPGAVTALLAAGYAVICHDDRFTDEAVHVEFLAQNAGALIHSSKTAAAVLTYTVQEFGRIDLLVSNDVFPLQHVPLETAEASDMRRACEALIVTPYSLLVKAATVMKRQGKGHVILITSAAPLLPEPGFSTYCTARAGASALVRVAVRELAPYGISVNAIAPNYLASETYYPEDIWDTHEARERLRNLLPAGRLGKASEIGSLIVFLSSGQADFINGEVINLTGGWP